MKYDSTLIYDVGMHNGDETAQRCDPQQTMTPARGREMIDFVRAAFRVSIRACRTVPACRATYHYHSRRPEQAALRQRIREVAETRIRYGYRRTTVLLRREGWHVNVKRVHRLYRLEGLQMRLKPPTPTCQRQTAR
jgi:hypothetical protein